MEISIATLASLALSSMPISFAAMSSALSVSTITLRARKRACREGHGNTSDSPRTVLRNKAQETTGLVNPCRWGRPDFSTPGFFNRHEFKDLFEQTEEWQTKGA